MPLLSLPGSSVAGTNGDDTAPSATAAAGKVIFDRGPSTGNNSGTCWVNNTSGQNFSDPAPLPAGTVVTGIVLYSCGGASGPSSVTFKAVDENSHVILHTESGVPSSWVYDGGAGVVITYMLQTPFVVPAGINVGYGLSGDTYDEIGQNSVLSPADGLMTQFYGSSYNHMAGIGDQMFQLLGRATCDVDGDGKYGVADLLAFTKDCKHSGGRHCLRQTIKLAKECGNPAD